jgi:hypothetical protein
VAEIEEDAEFFFAPAGEIELADTVDALRRHLISFFRAFNAEVGPASGYGCVLVRSLFKCRLVTPETGHPSGGSDL